MAGLLDLLNSDDARQGIGLLAAAGPRADGMGFGGRLQEAMGNYQALKDADIKRQMAKLQLDQLDQQMGITKQWRDMWGGVPGQSAQAEPMSPQMDAASAALGAGAQAGNFGPTVANAARMDAGVRPAATGTGGLPMIPGIDANTNRMYAMLAGPQAYLKEVVDKGAPQTDFTKLLVAAGIDPKSASGQTLINQQVAKSNYVAPTSLRGQAYTGMDGVIKTLPDNAPAGYMNQVDGKGNWSVVPVAGGLAAVTGSTEATETGKANAKPTVAYDANGKPIFSTAGQDLRRATGTAPAQPASDGKISWQGDPRQSLEGIMAISDPKELKNALRSWSNQYIGSSAPTASATAASGSVTPERAAGMVKGADLSQDELSGKGKELMAANAAVPAVVSRLQNIKMLAPGAITSGDTGIRDYFNNWLALAGLPAAKDAKTASDLVEKNSAQIVAALRMGSSGGGSDALQTLLGAGNPNRKMSPQAIAEAADQLLAGQQVVAAKAKLLNPHYQQRDPVAYANKELEFDSNADPRIWQWMSIKDPAAKKAFAAKVLSQEPNFTDKITALQKMGVIQ